jgi:hypothetical protein
MVARGATSAYRGLVAFCPLAPLLPFASHSPAGCRITYCRVPPPRVTFRRAAASRVQTMATARHAVAIIVDFVVRFLSQLSLISSSVAPSPSSSTSSSVAPLQLSSSTLSSVAPSQSSMTSSSVAPSPSLPTSLPLAPLPSSSISLSLGRRCRRRPLRRHVLSRRRRRPSRHRSCR